MLVRSWRFLTGLQTRAAKQGLGASSLPGELYAGRFRLATRVPRPRESQTNWKCDRALRTETTINEPRDLGVGKLLANLLTLRRLGRDINRRLLYLERQTHHCTPAATTFEALIMPTGDPDRRAPGLHFGNPRVVSLLAALSEFRWVCDPIRSRTLRPLVEHYLARPYTPGEMAYDLRRLCRKQILERLPHSHCYRLTPTGRQLALFTTKLYERALCPGLGQISDPRSATPLAIAWRRLDREVARTVDYLHLSA